MGNENYYSALEFACLSRINAFEKLCELHVLQQLVLESNAPFAFLPRCLQSRSPHLSRERARKRARCVAANAVAATISPFRRPPPNPRERERGSIFLGHLRKRRPLSARPVSTKCQGKGGGVTKRDIACHKHDNLATFIITSPLFHGSGRG